jgi:hypothetical protein
MYIKINAAKNTITLCKLIFHKSNWNANDFNWIYNKTPGFSNILCDCDNIKSCKSKFKENPDNINFSTSNKYNINISKKYRPLFKMLN